MGVTARPVSPSRERICRKGIYDILIIAYPFQKASALMHRLKAHFGKDGIRIGNSGGHIHRNLSRHGAATGAGLGQMDSHLHGADPFPRMFEVRQAGLPTEKRLCCHSIPIAIVSSNRFRYPKF